VRGLYMEDNQSQNVNDIMNENVDVKLEMGVKEPITDKDPLAETIDLLKRTQANFENYRKQTEKRMEEMKQFLAKDIILQILPIIDNLELALKNVSTNNDSEFVKGIELIYAQLIEILDQYEIKPIDSERKKFDPYLHEPLMRVESDKPEGVIIEEFQKGYLLHGAVIRHAKVKVSAGKNKTPASITK